MNPFPVSYGTGNKRSTGLEQKEDSRSIQADDRSAFFYI